MKKFYFCLVACFGFIGTAVNAQKVSVAPVEVVPGTTASFTLSLSEGKADTYKSLQFDIKFPAGFNTVATDKETNTDVWPGSSATVNTVDAEGIVTVPISSSKAIANADVENLVTINFSVADNVALDTYQVTLSKIAFGYGFTDKDYASDVTFNVKVVDRLTLDENATVAPVATTKKVNVHVVRTIKANSWSTICLPISLTQKQANDAFGPDAQFGEFAGFSTQYTDDNDVTPDAIVLNFTKLTLGARSQLGAGKPYLIKTTKDITDFNVDDVQIINTVTNVNNEDQYKTDGSFVGTLVKTKVPADALFISGKQFWYSKGDRETKAFRGWFALGAVLDKETTDFSSRVTINFIDDDVTGITSTKTNNGEEIYTLSGQRVNKAGKGVYIVNGKKVIKK